MAPSEFGAVAPVGTGVEGLRERAVLDGGPRASGAGEGSSPGAGTAIHDFPGLIQVDLVPVGQCGGIWVPPRKPPRGQGRACAVGAVRARRPASRTSGTSAAGEGAHWPRASGGEVWGTAAPSLAVRWGWMEGDRSAREEGADGRWKGDDCRQGGEWRPTVAGAGRPAPSGMAVAHGGGCGGSPRGGPGRGVTPRGGRSGDPPWRGGAAVPHRTGTHRTGARGRGTGDWELGGEGVGGGAAGAAAPPHPL